MSIVNILTMSNDRYITKTLTIINTPENAEALKKIEGTIDSKYGTKLSFSVWVTKLMKLENENPKKLLKNH